MTKTASAVPRLALSMEEFADAYGIGRTTAYAEAKAGKVKTILIGRSRRVTMDEAEAYGRRLAGNSKGA